MNENLELLDLVFNYLKKINRSDTFENIWKSIASSEEIVLYQQEKEKSKDDIIADLYSDLVLDNRFVLTSEGMWSLRQFLKFEDIKKQYDYIDQFENTEEFDDIDLDEYNENDVLLNDKLNFEDDLDIEINKDNVLEENDNSDFINSELNYDDNFKENEFSLNDDNNKTIAEDLGITEEIDWKALEKEIEENN